MDTVIDTAKTSTAAMVGLVAAIVALLFSAVPIINNFVLILAALGLVFGIVGIVNIRKGKSRGGKIAVSAIVISALAFIIVLASQAMYSAALNEASKSLDQVSQSANETLDKATGNKTDELLKNDVSVDLGGFNASQDEYGFNTTYLPVTVTNKLDAAKSYAIQVEAVDAQGKRIADDYVYANDLGARQSQEFKLFQYVEAEKLDAIKAASFKIVSVSQS